MHDDDGVIIILSQKDPFIESARVLLTGSACFCYYELRVISQDNGNETGLICFRDCCCCGLERTGDNHIMHRWVGSR